MKTLRVNYSRILTIKNAKFPGYHFYINLNIQADFQICISVPLNLRKLGNQENIFTYLVHKGQEAQKPNTQGYQSAMTLPLFLEMLYQLEKQRWCRPPQYVTWENRNSHSEVIRKKDVLKNFAKFTGKHLYQYLLFNKVAGFSIIKETLAQVFSCGFCGIFKNTYFKKAPPVVAFGNIK